MFSRAVGVVIKRLRKEHSISQERLAELIDSHQVYVSEIERGLKTPSLEILYKISKVFDLSLAELVFLIEKEFMSEKDR